MSESIVKSETPKNLVQQNVRDKLIDQIQKIKEGRTIRVEVYKRTDETFYRAFINFAWEYFGIDGKELTQISEEGLECLADMIYEKTLKKAILGWIVCLSVPLLGWGSLLIQNSPNDRADGAIAYRAKYRKLKSLYGKNFFPHELLRSE